MGGVLLTVPHDETSADRKKSSRMEDLLGRAVDGECHAVGVPRQDRQWTQDHVLDPVGQGHALTKLQDAGAGDGCQPLLHLLGLDQLRVETFKTEKDRRHGSVPVPCRSEGPVKVDSQ